MEERHLTSRGGITTSRYEHEASTVALQGAALHYLLHHPAAPADHAVAISLWSPIPFGPLSPLSDETDLIAHVDAQSSMTT